MPGDEGRQRLLIVDDDPALLRMLERGFVELGFEVETAPSARAAIKPLLAGVPDLVILDIMMPELDGLELCRLIRQVEPSLPILFLTARDAAADEIAGLQAGADDYVTKPFRFDVLTARVRSLVRRRRGEPAASLEYLDLHVDPVRHVARRGGRELRLTSTEFTLLVMLLRNAERVLTKEQLLEMVWGYDFSGDVNIVEVYVSALRRKLEAEHEPRLIDTVRGVGYVLRAPAD